MPPLAPPGVPQMSRTEPRRVAVSGGHKAATRRSIHGRALQGDYAGKIGAWDATLARHPVWIIGLHHTALWLEPHSRRPLPGCGFSDCGSAPANTALPDGCHVAMSPTTVCSRARCGYLQAFGALLYALQKGLGLDQTTAEAPTSPAETRRG